MTKILTAVAKPVAEADEPPQLSEVARLAQAIHRVTECEFTLRVTADRVSGIHRGYGTSHTEADGLAAAIEAARVLADDAWMHEAITKAAAPATRAEIATCIAGLIAGFPAAQKIEPAFVRLLAQDVADLQPTLGTLQLACRKLRRTWRPEFGKAFPSIQEVLEAIRAEAERPLWGKAALAALPQRIDDGLYWLERAQALLETASKKLLEAKQTVATDLISETDDEIEF